MSSVKGALSVLLCGATLALGGTPASAKTYDIAEITGALSISGSIVTDGQFGVLSQADILSWNLTILHLGGSGVNLNSGAPSAKLFFGGSALSADNFNLFYNFSVAPSNDNFFFITQPVNNAIGFTTGLLELSLFDGVTLFNEQVHPGGNLPFAIDPTPFDDNIATPLPAALPLFATGLGALGLLAWRRKRKATV